MGSVSTIYNGVRQKLAGRALMDVAFSSTSTNGVQNKVIKAKFDEVDAKIGRYSQWVNVGNGMTVTYDATQYDELSFFAYDVGSNTSFTFSLPTYFLVDNERYFPVGGSANGTTNSSAMFYVSRTGVRVGSMYVNGTAVTVGYVYVLGKRKF